MSLRSKRRLAGLDFRRRRRTVYLWAVFVGVIAAVAVAALLSRTSAPGGHGLKLSASLPVATLPASPTTSTSTASTTNPPITAAPTTTTISPPVAPDGSLVAGVWRPIGIIVDDAPTLSATLLQGRPGGPLTGVVRINGANTRAVQYAGTGEPGGSWPNQGVAAASGQDVLLAAFNAGFHTYESDGGWYANGQTAVPLRNGAASFVIRSNGTATIAMFGRDVSLTPDVVSIRQNLNMLVDGGTNVSAASSWGAVLGGGLITWRSGVGVDGAGNLIWAGGPGLDPFGLAEVLIQAGAVRAMQTDINPMWVSFAYYSSPKSGTALLPGMYFGPDHWLTGSSRDFFAVVSRKDPARPALLRCRAKLVIHRARCLSTL